MTRWLGFLDDRSGTRLRVLYDTEFPRPSCVDVLAEPGMELGDLEQRESPNPCPRGGEGDHRACGQLGLELLDAGGQELGELRWLAVDDLTNEDHRRCGGAGRGQECAEVGIGGHDGSRVGEGEVDDLRIGRSGGAEVANVCCVVAGIAEQTRKPRWQVLIDE